MQKLLTERIMALMFFVVGIWYFLLAAIPSTRHPETILQIALLQPYAYHQIILGILFGTIIGAVIGYLPMTRAREIQRDRKQVGFGLALLLLVCLQIAATGRSTITPLFDGRGTIVWLYILPFNFSSAVSAIIVAGSICLRRNIT